MPNSAIAGGGPSLQRGVPEISPLPALLLYTRRDCHLCEEAYAMLVAVAEKLGLALQTVDVDADPALAARYGETIPVVTLEGEEVLAWPFTRATARQVLERTLRERW